MMLTLRPADLGTGKLQNDCEILDEGRRPTLCLTRKLRLRIRGSGRPPRAYRNARKSRATQLADDRSAAVGEHHGSTGFDRGRGLRGQYVDAWIKLLRGNADPSDQQRGDKANPHDL
jgi:hypothetical protein